MHPANRSTEKNSPGAKKRWTLEFVEGALPMSWCEVSFPLAPDLRATSNRSKMIFKFYTIDDICGSICSVAPQVRGYGDLAPPTSCVRFVLGGGLAASTN